MSFENYLLNKGYISYAARKVGKETEWIPIEKYYYSSMGDSVILFMKDDTKFIYGLNEYEKPATLIWPRPLLKTKKGICNLLFDDDMNRLFLNYTSDEIYNASLNRKGLYLEESHGETYII